MYRLLPSDYGDLGPFSHARNHFEFIHQPLGASEAESQTRTSSKTVPQSKLNIRDTRAFVLERQPNSKARSIQRRQLHRSSAAMQQRIARQFAGSRDHLGLINQGEPQSAGDLANPASHRDHVSFVGHWYGFARNDCHRTPSRHQPPNEVAPCRRRHSAPFSPPSMTSRVPL